MSDELNDLHAPKPTKPPRRASPAKPRQSRAYKTHYEVARDELAEMELRIKTALTLLKANGDNTCEGPTLKAAIGLLEGK